MGFLIDTNILINNDCLIKLEGNLSLSDISLFERFKNRTIDEKNRIYAETKEMMSKCHIGMFAGKGRYLKIF